MIYTKNLGYNGSFYFFIIKLNKYKINFLQEFQMYDFFINKLYNLQREKDNSKYIKNENDRIYKITKKITKINSCLLKKSIFVNKLSQIFHNL